MRSRTTGVVAVFVLAAALAAGMGPPDVGDRDPPSGDQSAAEVTFRDANGTVLATVDVRVADSPSERYQGLSGTNPLPRGHGMLFVYEDEAVRTFVMREMTYPLDMVFVAANGTITHVYHAEVETDDDLTRYSARARWVVEVPYGYTNETGVDAGDSVAITYT